MPTPTSLALAKYAAAYHAQRARNCAKFATNPLANDEERDQAKSYAVAEWRRRRDAECAVSRMLDDGRPRFERRFGGGAWTVGGAS